MLEKKYKTEDAGAKKFVIGKFLKYNMVDTKIVIKQVEEIQVLIHELHADACAISEQFQVGSIIEKLPPLWRDFKVYLKHKRREMSMEDLILRLRVEEDHRKGDSVDGARANVIESEPQQRKNSRNSKARKLLSLTNPKARTLRKLKEVAGFVESLDTRHKSVVTAKIRMLLVLIKHICMRLMII